MILSHENKFIFIHIPRTGGTIISKSLCKSMGIKKWKSFIGEPKRISPSANDLGADSFSRSWSEGYKHITVKEMKNKVDKEVWNSYFKFTFVRNPWDRTLSMYFKNRKESNKLVKSFWPESKMIFNSLIIIKYGIMNKESHQQIQSIENEKGEVEMDYIGRYKNIKKDYNKVCEKIGLESGLKGVHDQTKNIDYRSYYNDITKEIILRRKKRDVNEFGYSF